MTTIVYDHKNKEVACDSRYTRGDMIDTDEGDKTRKNDRGLWIFSGLVADYEDLMVLEKNEKAEVRPECCAILISGGEAFTVDTDSEGFCIIDKLTSNFAAGSGANFGLVALDFGKTAEEAVDYAKTRDSKSGGATRVFKLRDEENEYNTTK